MFTVLRFFGWGSEEADEEDEVELPELLELPEPLELLSPYPEFRVVPTHSQHLKEYIHK